MNDDDLTPDLRGHREDGMKELRQAYDNLLDELGVLQEANVRLRRREARHLVAVERQAVQIAKLDEYVEGKDLVRAKEIREILEGMR